MNQEKSIESIDFFFKFFLWVRIKRQRKLKLETENKYMFAGTSKAGNVPIV